VYGSPPGNLAQRVGLLGAARPAPAGPPFGRDLRFVADAPASKIASGDFVEPTVTRLAEREGFEPSNGFPLPVFKSDHPRVSGSHSHAIADIPKVHDMPLDRGF